jgi:DNA-binding transcriptional LysR family regulator
MRGSNLDEQAVEPFTSLLYFFPTIKGFIMPSVDFDLRQLEIFCKVVELKSFSRAAEVVFLTQASVSERIAGLESSIGAKLLDRLGRQILPTKAGELLYRQAIRLLDMKRTARMEMEDFLGLKQGEIHLGGSTIPGEYILPKIIGQFYKKYPFVSVNLHISDTTETERLVNSGDLELGVIGSRSSSKDLVHYDLWKDELVLIVNAGHRWANKKMVSLDELLEEPFIMREKGSGTQRIIDGALKASGLEGIHSLKAAAQLGSSTAVKEGVKSGIGVAIISSRALQTELKSGVLKTIKIKNMPPIKRNFYLIRDKRRILSPACQVMFDFLQASAQD